MRHGQHSRRIQEALAEEVSAAHYKAWSVRESASEQARGPSVGSPSLDAERRSELPRVTIIDLVGVGAAWRCFACQRIKLPSTSCFPTTTTISNGTPSSQHTHTQQSSTQGTAHSAQAGRSQPSRQARPT